MNTRAVFAGGYSSISPYSGPEGVGSTWYNIDYATIASTGNASGFGELSLEETFFSASSPTRGVFGAGGSNYEHTLIRNNTRTNVIDFVTFALRVMQ